jgi:hypothetical protein
MIVYLLVDYTFLYCRFASLIKKASSLFYYWRFAPIIKKARSAILAASRPNPRVAMLFIFFFVISPMRRDTRIWPLRGQNRGASLFYIGAKRQYKKVKFDFYIYYIYNRLVPQIIKKIV